MVNTHDLGSCGETRTGSNPVLPTDEDVTKVYGVGSYLRGPYYRKRDNRFSVDVVTTAGRKNCLLARVVLEIKIGRVLTGDETVDHIDGNPINDHPDNLQILSRSMNSKKSVNTAIKNLVKAREWLSTEEGRSSLSNRVTGSKNPATTLSENDVKEIRRLLLAGSKVMDVAGKFNISRRTVQDIKARRSWKHV